MATEGTAPFDGYETWYRIEGELQPDGPAPLVTLHGGPGATHDYLLSLVDLARDSRAVVFYDQLGNGNSTHLPERMGDGDFWTPELFVRELANLVDHLGIGSHHVLGQSWGGFLAQEYALTQPPGLRSLILANTAASFPDFLAEANRLRAELPTEVEATLRRHEEAGTTDDPEYTEACMVFYGRHVCRLPEWPPEIMRAFEHIDEDPTVYHTMNGPSEFHVIGSIKDWQAKDRLGEIRVPTLVVSGLYDEATPVLQETFVEGLGGETEQAILEESSHMPFWEEREKFMSVVGDWLARHD
jgi:L-proline amide hydrolase